MQIYPLIPRLALTLLIALCPILAVISASEQGVEKNKQKTLLDYRWNISLNDFYDISKQPYYLDKRPQYAHEERMRSAIRQTAKGRIEAAIRMGKLEGPSVYEGMETSLGGIIGRMNDMLPFDQRIRINGFIHNKHQSVVAIKGMTIRDIIRPFIEADGLTYSATEKEIVILPPDKPIAQRLNWWLGGSPPNVSLEKDPVAWLAACLHGRAELQGSDSKLTPRIDVPYYTTSWISELQDDFERRGSVTLKQALKNIELHFGLTSTIKDNKIILKPDGKDLLSHLHDYRKNNDTIILADLNIGDLGEPNKRTLEHFQEPWGSINEISDGVEILNNLKQSGFTIAWDNSFNDKQIPIGNADESVVVKLDKIADRAGGEWILYHGLLYLIPVTNADG